MSKIYKDNNIHEPKYPSTEETTDMLTKKAAPCIATHKDGRYI